MNNEKIHEALSAYLDGETELPEALAQRLKSDPELAKQVQQWQQLSTEIQDLPKPEPHPAFSRRILARLEDTPQKHPRPVLVFGTPLALAATVLCVISGVFLLQQPVPENDEFTELVAQAKIYQDDEAVVAALASLLAQEADISYFSEVETESEWTVVTVDEWVDTLASETTETYESSASDWNLDVYGAWESLSEEEAQYLLNTVS